MNALQWQTKCAYIARVTDAIARDGIVPANFNGELAVFIRYCETQRRAKVVTIPRSSVQIA